MLAANYELRANLLRSGLLLAACRSWLLVVLSFFLNDTATTEIYTLSLHDALPIYLLARTGLFRRCRQGAAAPSFKIDRKSTRLNSSHPSISYAVFCLKKKKTK